MDLNGLELIPRKLPMQCLEVHPHKKCRRIHGQRAGLGCIASTTQQSTRLERDRIPREWLSGIDFLTRVSYSSAYHYLATRRLSSPLCLDQRLDVVTVDALQL